MQFEYREHTVNLLDTPGHEDFSEDTYRVLTAVDAAVMVIDGAKGVESQTRKLFEVCRLRDLPILTFCNKMDRESRDTFEIIDEIQEALALDVADRVGCRLLTLDAYPAALPFYEKLGYLRFALLPDCPPRRIVPTYFTASKF